VIGWIRIGDDARGARRQQAIHELPDEAGAMAAFDHLGLADEQIDAARTLGLRSKAGIPCGQIVTLQVTERTAGYRDDKLVHGWLIEVTTDQTILFFGIAPPFPDMWQCQPAPDQRKIGRGHRTERIIRRHQPLYSVSRVTLRLV
jgi:hypothetical protein